MLKIENSKKNQNSSIFAIGKDIQIVANKFKDTYEY